MQDDITAEDFPEVPATSYLREVARLIEVRSRARTINIVAASRGGTVTNQQVKERHKLLKMWDKAPTVQRISALEALTKYTFGLAVCVLMAPAAMALTAYEQPEGIAVRDIPEGQKVVSIFHTYHPPKGRKVHFYRLNNSEILYVSGRRLHKLDGIKIRDERPLEVIHPKLKKWRDRILFFGPFWTLFTDTAVKGAVGSAATGVSN